MATTEEEEKKNHDENEEDIEQEKVNDIENHKENEDQNDKIVQQMDIKQNNDENEEEIEQEKVNDINNLNVGDNQDDKIVEVQEIKHNNDHQDEVEQEIFMDNKKNYPLYVYPNVMIVIYKYAIQLKLDTMVPNDIQIIISQYILIPSTFELPFDDNAWNRKSASINDNIFHNNEPAHDVGYESYVVGQPINPRDESISRYVWTLRCLSLPQKNIYHKMDRSMAVAITEDCGDNHQKALRVLSLFPRKGVHSYQIGLHFDRKIVSFHRKGGHESQSGNNLFWSGNNPFKFNNQRIMTFIYDVPGARFGIVDKKGKCVWPPDICRIKAGPQELFRFAIFLPSGCKVEFLDFVCYSASKKRKNSCVIL